MTGPSWDDLFDRVFAEEAAKVFGEALTETPETPKVTVQKIGYALPISSDLAMDYGLIPDTRPPAPKPSLRRRLRWWLADHKPHLHFGPCPQEDA